MHILQFALRWRRFGIYLFSMEVAFHSETSLVPLKPLCICVLCFATGETEIHRWWSWWSRWWKSKLEVKYWSWKKLKSNRRIHKENTFSPFCSPQPNTVLPKVLPSSSRHNKATHHTKLVIHTSMLMLLFIPVLMFSVKRLWLNSYWVHWQNKFSWIQLRAR